MLLSLLEAEDTTLSTGTTQISLIKITQETLIALPDSGHALDQVRNRGRALSVVENIIAYGEKRTSSQAGMRILKDSIDNVEIIVNEVGQAIRVK